MGTSKKLFIIVVTYNAARWLDYCLSPFADRLPPDWQVLAVDNASSDDSVAILKNRFPWVRLFENRENLGFGRANNIAMRAALAEDAEYVFLLNQDARISVEAIARLVDIQSRHPESFITSPVHLAGNETELDLPFSQYCAPSKCPGLVHDALRGELSELYFSGKGNAAAWLLSRECLERVGGFNPWFHHYGEDDDYVNRVLHQGGKVGIAPGVFAAHNRKQSASTRPPDYKFLRKLVKYADPARKRPSKTAVLALFIPTLTLMLFRRRALAAHYAKVMADMLKKTDDTYMAERNTAPYLR